MRKKYSQFEEAGRGLINIAKKLCENEDLCKLLKFSTQDPLAKDLDENEEIFMNNISIIPSVNYDDLEESKIVISLPEGNTSIENDEFSSLVIQISIFTTMDSWIINDDLTRPFRIMDLILNLLQRKTVTSIGTLLFDNFQEDIISDEVTCHTMIFRVDVNG